MFHTLLFCKCIINDKSIDSLVQNMQLHSPFSTKETYQTGHGENRGWKINIFIDYHLGNLGLVEEEIGSGFRIYHQNLAGPHVEEVQQAFELVLLQPEVVSKSHCPTPYARCAAFIC